MDNSWPPTGEPEEQDPALLLAQADGLRDRRAWQDAASAYAAYLRDPDGNKFSAIVQGG